MKRTVLVDPAYDCIRVQPCKFGSKDCVPGGGGSHGRHNEEWTYIVSDGEAALSLAVFSGIYLYPDRERQKVRGAYMHLHLAWPLEEEDIRLGKSRPCDWLDAGACFTGGSWSLYADEFYAEHGREAPANQDDQPESFWAALEAFLAEQRAKAEAARALKRCQHCDGRGIVRAEG